MGRSSTRAHGEHQALGGREPDFALSPFQLHFSPPIRFASQEQCDLSDLAWAEALHARMESTKLSAGGRLICPFLRPNFISRRQYDSLVKTGEFLISAIDRMEQMVLASPALLARLDLLPAEKMLAAIDPGYQ